MNKWVVLLSLLATGQLGLASVLWYQQHQQQAVASPLLELDTALLTHLQLEHQGKRLQLERKDGQWLLPDLKDEPAHTAKVQALLSDLEKSRLHWPVADSSASQQRLDVAEDKFQWKLTLTAGAQKQQIYLGQSPAFKQLYLRRGQDAEIYQLSLNTLDWSTDPQQWFDKNLLQLNQLSAIRLQDLQLKKNNSEWQLRLPDATTAAADKAAAEKLQNLFSTLQVTGPTQSTAFVAKPAEAEQQLEIEVQTLSGSYRYQLKKQQEQYLIKRDDKAGWYPLAAEDAEQLFSVNTEQLLAKQSSSETQDPASAEKTGPR